MRPEIRDGFSDSPTRKENIISYHIRVSYIKTSCISNNIEYIHIMCIYLQYYILDTLMSSIALLNVLTIHFSWPTLSKDTNQTDASIKPTQRCFNEMGFRHLWPEPSRNGVPVDNQLINNIICDPILWLILIHLMASGVHCFHCRLPWVSMQRKSNKAPVHRCWHRAKLIVPPHLGSCHNKCCPLVSAFFCPSVWHVFLGGLGCTSTFYIHEWGSFKNQPFQPQHQHKFG